MLIKPIPMIGVIALALADLLHDLPRSSVSTVWAVGFFMLPSYIFEECFGVSFHDFLFEKLAFESRIATGAARVIGLTDSALPEPGAGTHLSRAGLTTEKLNRSLRRQKA